MMIVRLDGWLYPVIVFLLIAAIAAIPLMCAAPVVQDSFWIDYVWADRFHSALAGGTLYPRWLDGSFGGLGTPVFYFYAPLVFYATSVGIALGLGVYPALIATFVGFHALSGMTMYRWLGGRDRAAFGGAILYMLLPYHLIDFYRRGALAEFAAYAFLPVLALCMRKTDTRKGMAALALAYAALVMTHLPTALLASVLVVPAMMLREPHRKSITRTGFALAWGLVLASVYLLPALSLQSHTNMASLWGKPEYNPVAWSMFSPKHWVSNASGIVFSVLEIGLAVAAIATWRRQNAFWPVMGLFACLVAANVVPGFWSLPALDKVQFPWRALTIAEFAIATAFARWLANPSQPRRVTYMILPVLVLGIPILLTPFAVGHPTLAELDRTRPDVPEYLPGAAVFRTSRQAEALAQRTPDSFERNGWTIRRRFWFPAVVVQCGGRPVVSYAQRDTGLLTYRTIAGCTPSVTTGLTSPERIGWLLSLLGLATAIGLACTPSPDRKICLSQTD